MRIKINRNITHIDIINIFKIQIVIHFLQKYNQYQYQYIHIRQKIGKKTHSQSIPMSHCLSP